MPVTSNTANISPFQVLLGADSTGLPRDSKAQAEQVRSVDVERIGALVGTLDGTLRAALDEAHLAFSLMVTLIWLYITLLKLIALLTRNR